MPRYRRELQFPEPVSGLVGQGNQIFRQIFGIDEQPRPMADDEVADLLGDPLAVLLLRRDVLPASVIELLDALDRHNDTPGGLPLQDVFLVGEGSQISPGRGDVSRDLRFVVARRSAEAPTGEVDLLVSTAASGDPATEFLQVLAWDPKNEVFNYYQRIPPARWAWAGSSKHALEPGSRGMGPFDSHVNGSLVMKELKAPWNNWHSMAAGVSDALVPGHPRLAELFRQRRGAEHLERDVVKPGISRWNEARVSKAVGADGTIAHVPYLLRQVLETTTINLASSTEASRLDGDQDILDLPLTFFINADALFNILELAPNVAVPMVSRALYRDSLRRLGFALTSGSFRQEGDTFFAFLVPEPAFEDLDLLQKMVGAGLLARRLVASLLMVDFPNPVFSARRAQLMQHVPETVRLVDGGPDLSEQIARAIVEASDLTTADSPEREFADNWRVPEHAWQSAFESRIEAYFVEVTQQLATADGFEAYMRLAESRRREINPFLKESALLVPVTNIPTTAPLLRMTPEGTIVPV